MAYRIFNSVVAATGLSLIAPLLAAVALAIKCDDGGPVFYIQPRMGRGFHPFGVIKFRTMAVNADQAGLLTAPNDARLTRAGHFLRKYKLDELPQLWNVLRGDMQLVGPRPEVARYVEVFREQYSRLLNDCPGITDPASLAYRHEDRCFVAGNLEQQYLSRILPHKLHLSLEYQRRRTFFSDMRVLVRTVLHLAI